jgi:hypothetical protein
MTEDRMRARRMQRDRAGDTRSHSMGTCGPMASLCSACARDEAEWLKATYTAPALPGEEPGDYAGRTGLPMVDGWFWLACLRIREIGTPHAA